MNVNNPGSLTGYNSSYTLPDMKTMAERVKDRRAQLKMTQNELAELVGCSQPQIAKIERGGKTSLVVELAKALQVDAEWLKRGVQSADKSRQTTGEEEKIAAGENTTSGLSVSPNRMVLLGGSDGRGDAYIYLPRLVIKSSESGEKLTWEIDEVTPLEAFPRAQAERLAVHEEHSAFVSAPDDSNAPRIVTGDSLVVDYGDKTIVDGKMYALIYNNTFAIRRITVEPTGYTIAPDNTQNGRFRAFSVPANEISQIEIVGQVKAVIGGV